MSTETNVHSGGQELGDVAKTLTVVARLLESEPGVEQTVKGIVGAVIGTVPGADHAAVSLWTGIEMQTVAATGDLARKANAIEHELREGPCVDAVSDQHTYRIDTMAEEVRWPNFAAAAQELGIGSMLGYRLFTSERTLGSLDLYAFESQAFDAHAELTGELFATHAAIALIGSTREAEFQRALNTRDTIGMAKGILMNREQITADQAFGMLVSASQHTNMKLHHIAAWLVTEANKTD